MYKCKIFLLFFCFLIAAPTPATPLNGPVSSLVPLNLPDEKQCNLPAPAGLVITNVTPSSLSAQWLVTPGAASYLVEAFDATTNAPLGIPVVSASSFATITGLPQATLVRIDVSPMCSPTEISPNKSSVLGRTGIVIEIIAGGYNCIPNQNWTTPKPIQDGVTITEGVAIGIPYHCEIYRQIGNETTTSSFDLVVDNAANIYNDETALGSFQTGGDAAPFSNDICTLRMYSMQSNMAQVSIKGGAGANIGGIKFRMATCSSGAQNREDTQSGTETTSIPAISISPNPFKDVLSVYMANQGDGEARIQLIQINGAIIASQTQALSGSGTYLLNTASLPVGMYVLRVETPLGVQTRLVNKAE